MKEIEGFWTKVCSDDFEIQEEGFGKWREFDRNHPKYFESMMERFSKKFYETYRGKVLHDFHILNMGIICNTSHQRAFQVLCKRKKLL